MNLVPGWLEFHQRQCSPSHPLICGNPSRDMTRVLCNTTIDALNDGCRKEASSEGRMQA
ncbi:MAG: hypothetical protein HYX66_10315 [Ignavibacteria bacterium]|nr:hypothetical protein [Ignavibacteria bacterium]